tara:strand:+ start:320 stop:568 length:249 start_codon:yes stop_codon:yes gene_type:complete
MLREYLMDIEYQGKEDTLKTFAHTVEGAIDNAVGMDCVDKLKFIADVETKEIFEFDADLTELRKLKKKIPDNIKMFFSIKKD